MSVVALLFLTYDKIIHINKFKEKGYLDNPKIKIFIHPKNPPAAIAALPNPLPSSITVLKNTISTKWADISIVRAELELLRIAANSTPNASHFILCAHDSYPLLLADDLYADVSAEKESTLTQLAKNKASQWWLLTAADARRFLSLPLREVESTLRYCDERLRTVGAPDETFFLNVLQNVAKRDRRISYNTRRPIHYTKWYDWKQSHPVIFRRLLTEDADTIARDRALFIRKTFPDFEPIEINRREMAIVLVIGINSKCGNADECAHLIAAMPQLTATANIFILNLDSKKEPPPELTKWAEQVAHCNWQIANVEHAYNIIDTEMLDDWQHLAIITERANPADIDLAFNAIDKKNTLTVAYDTAGEKIYVRSRATRPTDTDKVAIKPRQRRLIDATKIPKYVISNTSADADSVESSYNYTGTDLPRKFIDNSKWAMTQEAIENTMSYIFDKLRHPCYLVGIKNKRLFFYKLIPQGETAPQFIEQLERGLKNLSQLVKDGIITGKQAQQIRENVSIRKSRIMQCVVKPYVERTDRKNEYAIFLERIVGKLHDGVFIFNLTDAIILRDDGKEPFQFISGDVDMPEQRFRDGPFLPILGQGETNYADIPIPNYDEIERILNKTFIKNLDDEYGDWDDKRPRAIFRGSASGCGTTKDSNMRIKLGWMVSKNTDTRRLIDACLIAKKGDSGIKFDPRIGLSKNSATDLSYALCPNQDADKKTMIQQASYRYIIHIDGNVNAYRLLNTMLTGSLIIRVKSPYIHWADHLLIPNVHYIECAEDLSDLTDIIKKCNADTTNKYRIIAETGQKRAHELIQTAFIEHIFISYLNYLSSHIPTKPIQSSINHFNSLPQNVIENNDSVTRPIAFPMTKPDTTLAPPTDKMIQSDLQSETNKTVKIKSPVTKTRRNKSHSTDIIRHTKKRPKSAAAAAVKQQSIPITSPPHKKAKITRKLITPANDTNKTRHLKPPTDIIPTTNTQTTAVIKVNEYVPFNGKCPSGYHHKDGDKMCKINLTSLYWKNKNIEVIHDN